MRCPRCGSKNIQMQHRNDGYNMSKGIIGSVVLGPVGAVAGINGKTSDVYACSDCGGVFSEPMNFVMEHCIDSAASSGNTPLLSYYKTQYRNIEISVNAPSTVYGGSGSARQMDIDVSKMSESQIKQRIKELVSDCPYAMEYGDFLKLFDVDSMNIAADTLEKMETEGTVLLTRIDSNAYIEIAKTPEQVREFALRYTAKKTDINDYVNEILNYIFKTGEISRNGVINYLLENHSIIKSSDNPYLLPTIVERIDNQLRGTDRVVCYEDMYREATSKEYEKKLYERCIKKNTPTKTAIEHQKTKTKMTEIMKVRGEPMSVKDFQSWYFPQLSAQRISADLRDLVKKGRANSTIVNGMTLFSYVPGVVKEDDDKISYDEGAYKAVLSVLKKADGPMLFSQILEKGISKSTRDVDYYAALINLQKDNLARRTEDENDIWWSYFDKNKEARERLLAEKKSLRSRIQELEGSSKEIEKNREESIGALSGMQFDGSKYRAKVSLLNFELHVLENKLSSLRNKPQGMEYIDIKSRIAYIKGEIEGCEAAYQIELSRYNNGINEQILRINQESISLKNEIKEIQDRIYQIDHELKAMK